MVFFIALSVIFTLLMSVPARAVSVEETIALNFLQYLRSDKRILAGEIIDQNFLDPTLMPVKVAYLFSLQGGGYILVSSDRSISPVKAYSLTSDFTSLPETYRKALLKELELRVRVAEAAIRSPLSLSISETEQRWDFLSNLKFLRMPLTYTPGTNLLSTQWNQDYPYNKFLPSLEGQTVAVGCVNVALAQLMRYHKYPASSKGVLSYPWKGPPPQTLTTILNRSYNWDNMPDTITSTTPDYQLDEIALLLKDLGIANRTDFDATGSSTLLQKGILFEYFGYSTSLSSMRNDDSSFFTILQTEIAASRPVLFAFVDHMTVADGYSADNAGQKIHINMGWGGNSDNFYFLDKAINVDSYIFPTDAGKLEIYFHIKPCINSENDCYTNLEADDRINGLMINGNFNLAEDTDKYETYLKGLTTLNATRGYSNLAFFVSIINAVDGTTVFAPPDPINTMADTVINVGSLPAGKYIIRVSPCSDDGACYDFDPSSGYNRYTVTLTTDVLTLSEQAAIDMLLDKPPVISTVFPDIRLNSNSSDTYKILIDARDENGHNVILDVWSSNRDAIRSVLNGNILELTPTGLSKVSSRIVVSAIANGKKVNKSFTVMFDNNDVAFGKSFTVSGTFSSQDDVEIHRVILDGACSIHGDNGYSSHGFYTSVLDVSGTVITPANDTVINASFSRDIYQLRAALEQKPDGYYYEYKPGVNDKYILTISCPAADTSTTTIAGLLEIDLAGTGITIFSAGDVNGDGAVNLADAILVLKVLTGIAPVTGKPGSVYVPSETDTSVDKRVDLAEALFILQKIADMR